jgi:glycine cleavage system regulatory protein
MTLIGADRPGLVGAVADIVASHQGNWLESRMAHLGGQFAGILRVELPAEQVGPLTTALERLGAKGLSVTVTPDTGVQNVQSVQSASNLALLEIVGQDRPGIIRDISRALAESRVNVEDLHTECSSAAMSGENLFQAHARLQLPPDCNLETLRLSLEKIAADLIVEVNLEPLTTREA